MKGIAAMKMLIVHLGMLLLFFTAFTTSVTAADVNGRIIITGVENSKISVLLQINTNTGTNDMGGATIVLGFDNSLLNVPNLPQTNTDYVFHNFSGGNYSPATITKPASNMIWLNIDLPFNNSNNGTVVAGIPEWTDIATINFNLINSADSISLSWLTQSPYWGIFDANNTSLWNPGSFENFSGKIITDSDPPMLLDALLLDASTIELTFSEPLEDNSAVNVSNYTIPGGISINNAVLSPYKDKVLLYSSNHLNGQTYTVTAENIFDPAGNLICGDNNSAEYTCSIDNIPPTLTSIIVNNTQTLTVKFSERLDLSSALNKSNYSISGSISVNSVLVTPDSSGVVLKTGKHRDNTNYTITVSNIKDRAGNIISPNPSSMLYTTPKKGNGNPKKKDVLLAKSNSSFQFFTADKTIDGSGMSVPLSRWQSGLNMPSAINFDIGEVQVLDSLRISFYKWETGRLFEYSVFASVDSVNWLPLLENIWSENFEWTEVTFDPVQCRYVKIDLLGCNQGPIASIWEVEMYGTDDATSVGSELKIPAEYELLQNYPNPFNPSTKIKYTIPDVGTGPALSDVQLKIYDILGNEVITLVNDQKTPGIYEVTFDAAGLASGIYIYRLIADSFVETKKMVLLR